MKSFLSKYWKRILILVGIIFIVINIIGKCTAPHLLIEEFAIHGPSVESNININASEIISEAKAESPLNAEMTKIVIIFASALILACVISDLGAKKSSGKKK